MESSTLLLGAATLAIAWLVQRLLKALQVDSGEMSAATRAFLAGEFHASAECQPMVGALVGSAFTDDEAVSAQQMKDILAAEHLPYQSLIDNPAALLRCSPCLEGANGGLYTRFTVQLNLYAGTVVALGSPEQRAELVASQAERPPKLGCFAFTEKGAGVLSGAGVETTAQFDPATDEFVIHSPTPSATKNWISQGMFAERAVILANLTVGDECHGPCLFWATIADPQPGQARPRPRSGVHVTSLPTKTALKSLDNAAISFDHFRVPRSALLSRFAELQGQGEATIFQLKLPPGARKMLDVLVFRLLTGRIVLSEASLAQALWRLRLNWRYAEGRELWRGRKDKGKRMSEMPLVCSAFRDYGESIGVLAEFVEHTREVVASSIIDDKFTNDTVEATCMCKFLGTGFAVDASSAVRKVMASQALLAESEMGPESFIANATSAAEGDNTIMELKIVNDLVRGNTPMLPWALMARVAANSAGRLAVWMYLTRLARATLLGKRAIKDGQLLRDVAWARAHMRVIDVFMKVTADQPAKRAWLGSYCKVLMKFPVPLQA